MTVLTTPKHSKTHSVRLAFAPVMAPAPPARPIAHPASHADQRTRCPACDLREYLED
jgi:hypothetical protein